MEKPLSLTLLYTAGIAGDLTLLPALHTFLQRLKPADGQAWLLLDLGGSCCEAAWHCRATGGRSALIVLDGMGYHAANVAGALDEENRLKLGAQVTMALVDAGRDWTYHVPPVRDPGIIVTLRPRERAARLQIALTPAAETRLESAVLRLAAVSVGQVGEAVVDLARRRRGSCQPQSMPCQSIPRPTRQFPARWTSSRRKRASISGSKQVTQNLTTEENEDTRRAQSKAACISILGLLRRNDCQRTADSLPSARASRRDRVAGPLPHPRPFPESSGKGDLLLRMEYAGRIGPRIRSCGGDMIASVLRILSRYREHMGVIASLADFEVVAGETVGVSASAWACLRQWRSTPSPALPRIIREG